MPAPTAYPRKSGALSALISLIGGCVGLILASGMASQAHAAGADDIAATPASSSSDTTVSTSLDTPAEQQQKGALAGLGEFIDRLPDFLPDRLPGFAPTGSVDFYARPHFGDLIHRDYLRVPVGAREKITDNIETTTEVESYFTHGLGSGSAGYGLSNLRLGAKCEHFIPDLWDGGLSLGADFISPLSRPPMELTDGYRHFQPYLGATHEIMDVWHLLGYASLGGDFLEHTHLPSNFGRNELHANSMVLTTGVARDWTRFHASLTTTLASTALTSDEGRQVVTIRPEVVLPLKLTKYSRTQFMLTLGAHAVWGPDGQELGLNSSVRVEFHAGRQRQQATAIASLWSH